MQGCETRRPLGGSFYEQGAFIWALACATAAEAELALALSGACHAMPHLPQELAHFPAAPRGIVADAMTATRAMAEAGDDWL